MIRDALSFAPRWFALIALSSLLIVSACGGSDSDATDTQSPDDTETTSQESTSGEATTSKGKATLVLTGESIDFDIQQCLMDEENVLAGGPGKGNEDGQIAYLDVDFVLAPEPMSLGARIELGVDTQFSSSDEGYLYEDAIDPDHTLTFDGKSFTLEANFRSFNGSPIGPGTLTVDCR